MLDIERGESRRWVLGSDGVKRWADSGLPCEPPRCNECRYCSPDEIRDGDDYFWKDYCNLAEPGGKAIEIDEGECCPDWCPLLQPNTDLTNDDLADLLGGEPDPLPEEEADLRAAQGAAAMAAMRAGVRARATFLAANPTADVLAADAAERAAVSCWWGRFAAYAEGMADE